jgi:hypothetical protein
MADDMSDFLPGFEPLVLIPSNSMELDFAAPVVPFGGAAGNIPFSKREIPGTLGSGLFCLKRRNPATSGLKPEMVTGVQFRPRLRMDAETPTGGKGLISNRTPERKGIISTDTLGSNEGAPVLRTYAEYPFDEDQGYRFNRHPLHPAGGSVQSNPSRWSTFRFRVEQFSRSLSRARLAQIACRLRFYSIALSMSGTKTLCPDLCHHHHSKQHPSAPAAALSFMPHTRDCRS